MQLSMQTTSSSQIQASEGSDGVDLGGALCLQQFHQRLHAVCRQDGLDCKVCFSSHLSNLRSGAFGLIGLHRPDEDI